MQVFWDDDALLHDPPHEILSGRLVPYLESPDRLHNIRAALEAGRDFTITPADGEWPDILDRIRAVHSEDYTEYLATIHEEWTAVGGDKTAVFPETFLHRGMQNFKIKSPKTLSPLAKPGLYTFDLSCPITANTYKAALASVKVVLSAARALAQLRAASSPVKGVFALGRPPGHHAQDALCGGYCFLNNAAIATKYLLDSHGVRNVAILDIDYHHGNGTQQIFYAEPRVLYVSLHAEGDYPYLTGSSDETGEGAGLGFNYNYPLPQGTSDDGYCAVLETAAETIRKHDAIDCVVVSLGVDTYAEDPICEFALSKQCYPRMGKIIGALEQPTLFVMEGCVRPICMATYGELTVVWR
ncbi:uncharacterized protein BXZ73DRAFT_51057 [Epithele typhae]|uniref:uncharacterized protein n=1 Tax=Epithele typhae TaxID=378194 RepID=UPI002007F193|nr:uncharacterized protein BXZ73DRAFT_51057 [Epithele typhae]KAH9923199.1 hypothetical protein BXZ73DRAFT_51057 [Epithele typhae]